jgi:hypothetical protein
MVAPNSSAEAFKLQTSNGQNQTPPDADRQVHPTARSKRSCHPTVKTFCSCAAVDGTVPENPDPFWEAS